MRFVYFLASIIFMSFALSSAPVRAQSIAQCQIGYDTVLAMMNANRGSEVPDSVLSWALDFEKFQNAGQKNCPALKAEVRNWFAQRAKTRHLATIAAQPNRNSVAQAQDRARAASAEVFGAIDLFNKGIASRDAGDHVAARRIFLEGCDNRHGPSCFMAAGAVGVGKGGAADPQLAYTLFEKACRLGDANGCKTFGQLAHNRAAKKMGSGDHRGAVAMWKANCDLGIGRSCASAAYLLQLGGGDIAVDLPQSLAFANKSCDFGYEDGCKMVDLIKARIQRER